MKFIKEKKESSSAVESQYGVTLEENASFLTRGPGGRWAERDGGPRMSQNH